jgi:ribosomal protein S24E
MSLQSPKSEFGTQNQYGRVIYPSIENFRWSKIKYTLGVRKAKVSLQSSKTKFGAQKRYSRVIYPSFGKFTWSKKKYIFGGQKGENKSS